MENIIFSAKIVLPILLTILVGFVFSARVQWDRSFYRKMNTVIFRVLLPVNLFNTVYTVNDISKINVRVLTYLAASILFCTFIGWIAARLFISDPLQAPVIIQGSFRANCSIMGLSLIQALCAENAAEAAAFGSLCICIGTIVINIVAVPVLTVNGRSGRKIGSVLLGILKNPLVIGSLSGLVCVLVRRYVIPDSDFRLETQLPSVFKVISSLAKACSPIALFCLGASLDFKSVKELKKKIALGVVLRLVLCPFLVLGAAILFKDALQLTRIEAPALLSIATSPIALAGAVMVQEIGGDAQLANHLVVWSTAFCSITIFLFIFLYRSAGLL